MAAPAPLGEVRRLACGDAIDYWIPKRRCGSKYGFGQRYQTVKSVPAVISEAVKPAPSIIVWDGADS